MFKDNLPIINGKRVLNDDFVNNQMKKIAIEIGKENKNADLLFILEGFCGEDLEDVDMSGLSLENLRRLTFDSNTKFPNMEIEGISINKFAENLINQGKSFSNVIEEDESKKIDGSGTTIALLDRYFDSSIKEFEGRVVKHIVFTRGDNGEVVTNVAFDRENQDIQDTRDGFLEKYHDGSHGNTSACLSAGTECGLAPKAEMYIFSVGDVGWDEAKEAMLKYIKQENENKKMNLPDVISMSADVKNIGVAEEILKEFRKNGCIDIDSSRFWKDFLWGRIDKEGTGVEIDGLMQEVKAGYDKYPENGRARKIIDNMNNSIALPFTQRTTVHSGKDGKPVYKYNGTLGGASYAIPQIAGLFLLSRQIDKDISFNDFINILRDLKTANKNEMNCINTKEIIKKVEKNRENRIKSHIISHFHDQKSDTFFKDESSGVYAVPTQETLEMSLINNNKSTYHRIMSSKKQNVAITKEDDRLFLEEGTLIHGVEFDIDVLTSISNKGLIAPEFIENAKTSNEESRKIVMFYKVPDGQTMASYTDFCNKKFSLSEYADIKNHESFSTKQPLYRAERDFLPNEKLNKNNIAFIINPSEDIQELFQYDAFKEKNTRLLGSAAISKFKNTPERIATAIYGIPPNMISGIWVSVGMSKDEEKIAQIKRLFPDKYITTSEGELIYEPQINKKQENTNKHEYLISSNIKESMINNARTEIGQDVVSTSRELKNNVKELQNKDKVVKTPEGHDDEDSK